MAKQGSQGKSRRRRQSAQAQRISLLRRGIVIGIGCVVLGVAIGGLLYSTGSVDVDDIVEGEHYEVVADAPRRRPGAPVTVTEFFSYGCVHCRNFDPLIEDWRKGLSDGAAFERAPVAFSPEWAILGQAYLALERTGALAQNHERLFRAIHDNGRQFLSAGQIAGFVDGQGISREDFLAAYDSPEVRRALARNEARQSRLGITSVPALTVADKYRINMDVGRRQALEVADHLVALEQANRRVDGASGPESATDGD